MTEDKGIYQAFKTLLMKAISEGHKPDVVEEVVKEGEGAVETSRSEETLIKQFKVQEQVSVEIVYEPNVLDAHGEWMSVDTIKKACKNFNINLEKGIATPNLFHLKSETEKLEILETYILPCECTIGETVVQKGTWVAEVKWHDDSLWNQRTIPNEDGVLSISGLSLGGRGVRNLPKEESNDGSI